MVLKQKLPASRQVFLYLILEFFVLTLFAVVARLGQQRILAG